MIKISMENLLLEGSITFSPPGEGTFYAEAYTDDGQGGKCISSNRTAIRYDEETMILII